MAQSRSDSVRSNLAGGSDSYRSTLAGGSDYLFENCCDLCDREDLQKEAVGFCVVCQDYLCTECYRNHLKPKPMRHHVLQDQHQMPSREVKKTNAKHIMDIHVSASDDPREPSISGCVVLSGVKLVVVDRDNDTVKLMDLPDNSLVSQLVLPGDLWDITQVNSSQVAITSYQTIYVVNVNAYELQLYREVKVKGQCRGIASINGRLIVSYVDPVKVEIISIEGKVIQTVVNEEKGSDLFAAPRHIAVSRDQRNIYISDWDRDTITGVDFTGQVWASYKDKLVEPNGLTVDSAGRLYVCGGDSHNIMHLTGGLTEIQQLLKRSDRVIWPKSVYYCEISDRLYIGMWHSDVVKVYQLE